MEAIDLVNAVFDDNKEAAKDAFNSILAAKVSDALEVKKVEVASNFITTNDEIDSDEQLELTDDEEDNATESEEESDGTESE